jgi:hypothetical protein
MNNSINSAMNVVNVAANTTPPRRKFIVIIFLTIILIAGIAAAVTFFYKKYTSPFWSERAAPLGFMDSIRKFFSLSSFTEQINTGQRTEMPVDLPVQTSLMQAPERVAVKENWCFVGEDLKGRWCVQVPSDHACDPNRTFPSEEECSLVKASSMPLGVLQNEGSSMLPIGPVPAMSSLEI